MGTPLGAYPKEHIHRDVYKRQEQVNRNFASLGLDPEMNPWDRYVQWLTNVVTKFDWGRSPNGAYINQEFGQRVWVSTRLLLVATILSIVIGIALGVYSAARQYKFSEDVYKRQGAWFGSYW